MTKKNAVAQNGCCTHSPFASHAESHRKRNVWTLSLTHIESIFGPEKKHKHNAKKNATCERTFRKALIFTDFPTTTCTEKNPYTEFTDLLVNGRIDFASKTELTYVLHSSVITYL